MPGHAASGEVDWKVNVNDIELAHNRLGEFVKVVHPIESFGVLSVGRLQRRNLFSPMTAADPAEAEIA